MKLETLKQLENEMKKITILLSEKEKEILVLNNKIIQEQNEKMDILQEATKTKEILNQFEDQNKNLKNELDLINEKIKKNQYGVEGKFFIAMPLFNYLPLLLLILFLENIKARIQHEKTILIHEHDQDLENYQKLLKEYSALEQRNEHLEGLVEKLTSRHSRSPSEVSSLQYSQTSNEAENDVNLFLFKKLFSGVF